MQWSRGGPGVAEYTRPATWDDLRERGRFRHCCSRIQPLDGVPLRVLDLEGLLLTRQGVRPKDQMDAAVLRSAIEALKKSGG